MIDFINLAFRSQNPLTLIDRFHQRSEQVNGISTQPQSVSVSSLLPGSCRSIIWDARACRISYTSEVLSEVACLWTVRALVRCCWNEYFAGNTRQ